MASRPSENSENPDLARRAVVHDVSQMLAVITGRADLLLRRSGEGQERDDLEAIALAAADAAAMLRRLKDPGGPLPAEVCCLEREVRRVALLVTPPGEEGWDRTGSFGDHRRPLVLDVDPDLYAVVSGQVIREVLTNLFMNALEAMPERGGLAVSAVVEKDRVLLRVADQGPGLAPGLAEDVFNPGASSSGEPGRGIGLAGCRELLGRHDGDLRYLADEGPGAVFEVDLPLGAETDASLASSDEELLEDTRVLVIDDEPEVRSVLTDLLGTMGCRVSVARDAATGREVHAAEDFDVVMIDLTLPDVGGLELAAELRAVDGVTAIVAMTGVDRAEALAGADPGIVDLQATKPLAWDRIKELVTWGARLARDRRVEKEA